jgi:hypothetical protein
MINHHQYSVQYLKVKVIVIVIVKIIVIVWLSHSKFDPVDVLQESAVTQQTVLNLFLRIAKFILL